MAEGKQVIVKVKRQASPKEAARWEEFSLPWRPSMNVIICLRDIAENPVTRAGKKTTPVSYDSNCLEEVCGSCAMLINGKARMACSALVDQLDQLEQFARGAAPELEEALQTATENAKFIMDEAGGL